MVDPTDSETDSATVPPDEGLGVEPREPGAPMRPDIVVIMTDDQRADSLWAMPLLEKQMAARGISFDRAYATIPLCCPARASLLAGGRTAQATGVIANDPPNGGFDAFVDDSTLSTALQQSGYRTGFIGKYLNGWVNTPEYIAPGWDLWVGVLEHGDWYAGRYTVGSSTSKPGTGVEVTTKTYMTDYLRDSAVAFIEDTPADEPLFLLITPYAPHDPAEPATEDEGAFLDWEWRGGAFNEEDTSDKPTWLRNLVPLDEKTIAFGDEGGIRALQTLLAVDRMVLAVAEAIEARRGWDETLLVYTSDNGLMEGEHRLYGKAVPYEEAVRVPLWMALPGGARAVDHRLVAMNLDVPATIVELAGVDLDTDGDSLVDVLMGEEVEPRSHLLLEAWQTSFVPSWSALVTPVDKRVIYSTGDNEYYNLVTDPFEETSLHADKSSASRIAELDEILEPLMGLQVITVPVSGEVGVPLDVQLEAVGGVTPYVWSVADEATLPAGLTLDADGRLHGTPETEGTFPLLVHVEDSGIAGHAGVPHRLVTVVPVGVGAPPALPAWSSDDGEVQITLERAATLQLFVSSEDVGGEWVPLSAPTLHPPGTVRLSTAGSGVHGLARLELFVDGLSAGTRRTVIEAAVGR